MYVNHKLFVFIIIYLKFLCASYEVEQDLAYETVQFYAFRSITGSRGLGLYERPGWEHCSESCLGGRGTGTPSAGMSVFVPH